MNECDYLNKGNNQSVVDSLLSIFSMPMQSIFLIMMLVYFLKHLPQYLPWLSQLLPNKQRHWQYIFSTLLFFSILFISGLYTSLLICGNDVTKMTLIIFIMSFYLIRHYFPRWTNTADEILSAPLRLKLITIIILAQPIYFQSDSPLPNYLGFLLFILIIKNLENDRFRNEAQRAELRALHAQVEPHFLNNTLSSIQDLIINDPEKAQDYLAKLAVFFNETRKSASLVFITVEQELLQVQQYMDFQQLRFKDDIIFSITIPARLFNYELPPCSLQTLVENALTHSRRGLEHPLSITISGEESINRVILHVHDNGIGIAPERLALLTKQTVNSEYGSGTALYYLTQSLLLAFRGQASVTIDSVQNRGTTVTLSLPKELLRC